MCNIVLVHFFEFLELLHAFLIVICRLVLQLLQILVFSSLSISKGLYLLVVVHETRGVGLI